MTSTKIIKNEELVDDITVGIAGFISTVAIRRVVLIIQTIKSIKRVNRADGSFGGEHRVLMSF